MGAAGPEHHAETPTKPHISEERGTESGTLSGNFANAVASIMALPLTDAEKAQAVRRLLGGGQ